MVKTEFFFHLLVGLNATVFAAPAHSRFWHIESVRCDASTAIAIGGIADMSRSLAARPNDANDPKADISNYSAAIRSGVFAWDAILRRTISM